MSVTIRGNRWQARISVNGRRVHLGAFPTRPEAEAAYQAALVEASEVRVRRSREPSDPATRFFSKTRRDANGCLAWLGAKDKDGYGKFQLNGSGRQTHVRAHRFAFFLDRGHWPSELALHICDNTSCVEASHLEDGDQGKNVRDCVARGRWRSHHPRRIR